MPIMQNIDWTPGIGDPTFLGWMTVLAYFYAALSSFRVVYASHELFPSSARQRQLWLLLGLCLTFLALNKQLDLQTLFKEVMQALAIEQGWYGDRRVVQRAFIVALGVISVLGVALLWLRYRYVLRPHLLALTGFVFLLCFVLMRAASFHHMDYLLREGLWADSALRMNHVLELAGIALVILNAHLLLRLRKDGGKHVGGIRLKKT